MKTKFIPIIASLLLSSCATVCVNDRAIGNYRTPDGYLGKPQPAYHWLKIITVPLDVVAMPFLLWEIYRQSAP